jgi:hypothetical protein
VLNPGADHPLRKECNWLEAMQAAIEHDPDEVWMESHRPKRDVWRTEVLPVLRQLPQQELATAAALSVRRLRDLLADRAHPR